MGSLETVASIAAPVFLVIGIGYAYGKKQEFDEKTLTNLVFYVLSPFLVFYGISSAKFEMKMAETSLWAAAIMFAVALAALLVSKIARLEEGESRLLVSTAMFSNNGNMGFPIVMLAFGKEALAYAAFFVAASAFLMFSFGIQWISNGKRSWLEFLKVPMLYAVVAGVAVSASGMAMPAPAAYVINLLGQTAMGVMLLLLGMQLSKTRLEFKDMKLPALNAVLRLAVGPAVALAICGIFGITGAMKGALVLQSATPSAINNFVLASKYTDKSTQVAAMIFAATAASIISLPIVLAMLV